MKKMKLAALTTIACFIPFSQLLANGFETTPSPAVMQKRLKVSGVVQDSYGPVQGASVYVKGTTKGVLTDKDGQFTITCSPTDILTVSFMGYETFETRLKPGQDILSITLKEKSKSLDEVVVTAFGAGQKKETLVGSIQQVKPTELRVPGSSISSAFAGRLAGVVSMQRSGQPGSNGANFYIRGISTINGVTSPLIVMDGMEISSSDLEHLDPDVIESFSILKDASATAMYGTRGANGVMIITTKSGANLEKPVIGFRLEANIATPTKIPKFVDGPRHMELYNEAVLNEGLGNTLYTQEQIENTRNNVNPYIYPNVDWYKEIFKNAAFNQKANLNIRGGTSKIVYFMNLNVDHQTGMIKNVSHDYFSYNNNLNYTRYTFQNNINFNMTKSSKISLHLYAALDNSTGPIDNTDNIYYQIAGTSPVIFPVTFPGNGDKWVHWGYKNLGVIGQNGGGFDNPVARLTRGYQSNFASTITANLNFDQQLDFLTKGLAFHLMFSFKNWSSSYTYRQQGYNIYQLDSYKQNVDGTYDLSTSAVTDPTKPTLATTGGTNGDRRYYAQAYFDYNRSFGNHNISGMLLWNIDQYNTNIVSDLMNSLPQRKMGFAGRLTYDYMHRYLLEFNAGYNGSENFAAGHRWGFFPSVGGGIILSEENFWKPLKKTISNFKIRASYGLVGNDQMGGERFMYREIVGLTGAGWYQTGYNGTYQGTSGPYWSRVRNEDMGWEIGHKLDIGADIQLFNSLNIIIDWYREKRTNLFQQKYSVPDYLGTAGTAIYGNFAEVLNKGIDLSVDYNKRFGNDWMLQFKGTFTYSHNKVIKYDEPMGNREALKMVGKSLNTIYGLVADGLYRDQADIENSPKSTINNLTIAPGDIKYVDQPDANGNFDNIITSDDAVAMGYPTVPEIVYGFGPSIQYKKWDFSFFFQGAARVSFTINNSLYGGIAPFGGKFDRNVLQWIDDNRWSPDNQNPDALYPRLTIDGNNQNNYTSSYWLRNGAFLKLKNAEIGYSFKKCRIYINGSNLLTFSPFKLWDPEMGGGAGMQYPTMRMYNIGIQVTL